MFHCNYSMLRNNYDYEYAFWTVKHKTSLSSMNSPITSFLCCKFKMYRIWNIKKKKIDLTSVFVKTKKGKFTSHFIIFQVYCSLNTVIGWVIFYQTMNYSPHFEMNIWRFIRLQTRKNNISKIIFKWFWFYFNLSKFQLEI